MPVGAGSRGMFAQPWRAAQPRFVRLLTEVPRFHREARALLADDTRQPTWGEFLAEGGFSPYFVRHFAIPLVSCVWSCGDLDAPSYPARHLFQFLDHHGMLTVTGSPQWRTVTGGSATYVDRLVERLPDVRRQSPVTAVTRHDDGVDVRVAGGTTADAPSEPTTGSSSPPTPTRPSSCSPTRRPTRSATSAPSATPATRPGCTATPPCCPRRVRPRPRGTTAWRPATPPPPT